MHYRQIRFSFLDGITSELDQCLIRQLMASVMTLAFKVGCHQSLPCTPDLDQLFTTVANRVYEIALLFDARSHDIAKQMQLMDAIFLAMTAILQGRMRVGILSGEAPISTQMLMLKGEMQPRLIRVMGHANSITVLRQRLPNLQQLEQLWSAITCIDLGHETSTTATVLGPLLDDTILGPIQNRFATNIAASVRG